MTERSGIPTVSAVLFYDDLGHAARWLCDAFGFEERIGERVVADGTVVHVELQAGDSMLILSSPYEDFAPPTTGARHLALYVVVDDAAAHLVRASAHGATITSGLRDTDYGARVYAATDEQGYRWIFAQTLRAPGDEAEGGRA